MRKSLQRNVAILAALILAWLAWSCVAARKLQNQLDAIRARHEPLTPADFQQSPVDDSHNAAKFYVAAIESMSDSAFGPSMSGKNFVHYPPFSQEWHRLTREAIRASDKSLALAHEARSLSRANWHYAPDKPSLFDTYHLRLGALAELLGDAAMYAHVNGNDTLAIERVRDLLHESKMIGDGTGLTGRLVSQGIESMTDRELEAIAPDLQAAAVEQSPASAVHPVGRQTVMDVIHDLLDEDDFLQRRRLAAMALRAQDYDELRDVRSLLWLLRPMVDLETARMLSDRQRLIAAVQQPTWPAAQLILNRPLVPPAPLWTISKPKTVPRYSRMLSDLVPNLDLYAKTESMAATERRAAALSLAIRLFRIDHNAWPVNLRELTPTYLPAIPVDALSAKQRPIDYLLLPQGLPDGSPRPLLYFDAPDPENPGTPPVLPAFGRQSSTARQWRDLARWTP